MKHGSIYKIDVPHAKSELVPLLEIYPAYHLVKAMEIYRPEIKNSSYLTNNTKASELMNSMENIKQISIVITSKKEKE